MGGYASRDQYSLSYFFLSFFLLCGEHLTLLCICVSRLRELVLKLDHDDGDGDDSEVEEDVDWQPLVVAGGGANRLANTKTTGGFQRSDVCTASS